MRVPVVMTMTMLAAMLAGCTTTPTAAPDKSVPGVQCDATAVQDFVGRPADMVVEEAQRRSGARTVRRYRSGDPVTMDFRSDRLNIETDGNGRIVKLSCG